MSALRALGSSFPLAIVISLFVCLLSGEPRRPNSFAVLTLSVPSFDIPLPLQLVLANCWRLSLSEKAVSYLWWNLGCFGLTFVTETENLNELREAILQIWKQADWDLLVFRQGKAFASQKLNQWKREPMEWLRWKARAMAVGSRPNLSGDEPIRISLEEMQKVAKNLAQRDPPIVLWDGNSWSISPMPSIRRMPYSGFRLSFKFDSKRAHGLWWSVAKGKPEAALVLGELLGGGTGSKWFQLLRGDKPFAYHAVAQVQWTPIGAELSLYASTSVSDFKPAQQRARQMLWGLKQGQIDEKEFERAKQIAQLRLRQIESDPLSLSRELAVWAMSERSLSEWENLPAKLQSLTLGDLKALCRSMLPFSELLAIP